MQAQTPTALAGLRVLEFSVAGAASWLGRHLAFYGAEVVKVESAARPDVVRMYVSPREPETGVQPDLSPWLAEWHAGKRHLGVNLKHPEAAALIHRLVPHFDVVTENFSPGVMARLGIDYDALRQHHPGLIMISLSGFGQTGPHRQYISWGPNLEAISGWSQFGGFAGDPPLHSPLAIPDWLGGMHGILAVMAALEHRARTGEGQYIDLSQFESAVTVLGDFLLSVTANARVPERRGYRHPLHAPQGCYPCAGTDSWVAITVRSDTEWQRFCAVLGRSDWAADGALAVAAGRQAAADALDAGIAAWTGTREVHAVVECLQAAGIPAGLVATAPDLEADPHLVAREHFQKAQHLRAGEMLVTGLAGRMSGTPGRNGRAGALAGQDSQAVLQDLLGLSHDECQALIASGVVEVPQ